MGGNTLLKRSAHPTSWLQHKPRRTAKVQAPAASPDERAQSNVTAGVCRARGLLPPWGGPSLRSRAGGGSI